MEKDTYKGRKKYRKSRLQKSLCCFVCFNNKKIVAHWSCAWACLLERLLNAPALAPPPCPVLAPFVQHALHARPITCTV